MEQTSVVTLSSKRKVTLRTWPMRPSLRHADFVATLVENLAKKMGVDQSIITSIDKLPEVTIAQLMDGIHEVCALDAQRVFDFISDGCGLSPDEVESLSLHETLELAWEVGVFNLRPTQGLFSRLKKSRAKFTPPPQN